jgi:hypothetical protein
MTIILYISLYAYPPKNKEYPYRQQHAIIRAWSDIVPGRMFYHCNSPCEINTSNNCDILVRPGLF